VNFVLGAVRRNRLLSKPSNADVENEIKVWLRQSCDGGGGRRAREQTKKVSKARQPLVDDGSLSASDMEI